MYSKKEEAAWIFLDSLSRIVRRGWFSAGPSAQDGKSLLYVSFHVHPDDADRLFALIQRSSSLYGGKIEWILERHQHNRFILCPHQIALQAKELGNFGKAVAKARKVSPALEREAASDLIILSDFLYGTYLKERESSE